MNRRHKRKPMDRVRSRKLTKTEENKVSTGTHELDSLGHLIKK